MARHDKHRFFCSLYSVLLESFLVPNELYHVRWSVTLLLSFLEISCDLKRMCVAAKLTDIRGFLMCHLSCIKLHFPGSPFPLCFWLGWLTRHVFMSAGGQKWGSSHFVFYTQMVNAGTFVSHIHCCFSIDSSHWRGIAANPAAASSFPGSFFDLSDSWAKCV